MRACNALQPAPTYLPSSSCSAKLADKTFVNFACATIAIASPGTKTSTRMQICPAGLCSDSVKWTLFRLCAELHAASHRLSSSHRRQAPPVHRCQTLRTTPLCFATRAKCGLMILNRSQRTMLRSVRNRFAKAQEKPCSLQR